MSRSYRGRCRSRPNVVCGGLLVAWGVLALGNQLMWWTVLLSMLWPIVLIAAGLRHVPARRVAPAAAPV